MDMTQVKILVVEDQANYQALITGALAKEGFEVFCVGEGEPVVDLAQGNPVAIASLETYDLHC